MEIRWKNCRRIAITAFVFWLAIHYWDSLIHGFGLFLGAAVPLILGCIIAYVVNILMMFYETKLFRKRKKAMRPSVIRIISMLLAFLSIVLIVFFIARMVIPEMISCFQIMLKDFPSALDNAWTWADEHLQISRFLQKDDISLLDNQENLREILGKVIKVLATGVGGALQVTFGVVTSVFSALATFVIALIFSIYLLVGKEKIKGQCDRVINHYLPNAFTRKFYYVLGVLNESFHSFIVGQCTEAVILGLLCMLGMFILRIPYAAMVGCLIGFTALIPIAGAYIGAIVGAFLIFTVSPIKALIFLIFLVILQQVEGNAIYPRVVGSAIGLPGIWVLSAVVVGGGMMGVVGMLLGVPLASALYRLLRNDINGVASTKKS
ncbi:MAG: AI-2E family transporter [Lachnospiraceae bacterium]|nr:AI-2E family transporter [Lachnospiraceae bacterium]